MQNTEYTVRRLNVVVPDVRGFQADYQQGVPDVPTEEVSALVAAGGPWSKMVEPCARRTSASRAMGRARFRSRATWPNCPR